MLYRERVAFPVVPQLQALREKEYLFQHRIRGTTLSLYV